MRDIIKRHVSDLEIITGLKQFRPENMKKEDANRIITALEERFKSYRWMTEERVNTIMKNGMCGQYGDFTGINIRTISIWIGTYFNQNQAKISTEIQYKHDQENKQSPEEIEYWMEIGRNNFREKLQKAKETGLVLHISDWGIYWYPRFVKAGILKESDYPIEPLKIDAKKELRLIGNVIDEISVKARLTEKIWRLFILKMIKENFDFEPYLK